eukprot:scaffold25452_cov51-Phaeocystis_antarctica.AAC.2
MPWGCNQPRTELRSSAGVSPSKVVRHCVAEGWCLRSCDSSGHGKKPLAHPSPLPLNENHARQVHRPSTKHLCCGPMRN